MPQSDLQIVGDAKDVNDTGTTTTFSPIPRFSVTPSMTSTISAACAEIAYLNKALEMTLVDETKETTETFYFEGGIVSFVRHLNRNRARNTVSPSTSPNR